MKTILFQGDSITDAGRTANFDDLGGGYPRLVAARLGCDCPNDYDFINRGISGNRIVDMYARIKCDIINLKPDYMSLLLGVNDVWHEIDHQNGVDAVKFEKIYTMLIEEILEALPNIKIILFGPYVMQGSGTVATEEKPDKWTFFSAEVAKRAEITKRIAEKFGLTYVDLQEKFGKAAERTGDASYWTADGVHPTVMGHELIARAWLDAFNTL